MNFYSPTTLSEALILKSSAEKMKILSGGSDLIVGLNSSKIQTPEFSVLSLSRIRELQNISEENGWLHIGASVNHTDLIEFCKKYKNLKALEEAASLIGSPAIRNIGTIGGNIVNGSPAGDLLPPLYCLEAELELVSSDSRRNVLIDNFFTGPKKTIISEKEILSTIKIKNVKDEISFFKKCGQRKACAISKANIAVALKVKNQTVSEIKIALGSVAPVVLRAKKTENYLKNINLSKIDFKKVDALLAEESRPISDIRSTKNYRSYILGALFEEELTKILY